MVVAVIIAVVVVLLLLLLLLLSSVLIMHTSRKRSSLTIWDAIFLKIMDTMTLRCHMTTPPHASHFFMGISAPFIEGV